MIIIRKIILLSFYLSISGLSYSQFYYTSTIVDESSNAVSYASIENLNHKSIIYTDVNGMFKILYKSLNDTLKISSIGFTENIVTVGEVINRDTIFIKKQYKLSDTVVVFPNNGTKYLNSGYHKLKNGGYFDLGLGSQLAAYISNPLQKDISLAGVYFRVLKKGNCETMVRIRLFEVDFFQNVSDIELLHDNVVMNSKDFKKLNYINLLEYNVIFPSNGAYVVLEILNSGIEKCNEKSYPIFRGTLEVENDLVWIRNSQRSKWVRPHRSRYFLNPNVGVKLKY